MKKLTLLLVAVLCVGFGSASVADAEVMGSLLAWGDNGSNQCDVPDGNDFVAVAAGGFHSLALTGDGEIVSWGGDLYGQVGSSPVGDGFVAIAAGTYHSLALTDDGSLFAWGRADEGYLAVPDGNDFVAVAPGLGLRMNGSLAAWGPDANVPGGSDYVAIASGPYHNLALKEDGSLEGWGSNAYGQSDAPDGNDFAAIQAGMFHSLALKTDGSLEAWGNESNDYWDHGQVTDTPAGSDFDVIAAGSWHNLAIREDGTLVGWGDSGVYGEANVPDGNDFFAIAAGSYHGVAIKAVFVPVVGDLTGDYYVDDKDLSLILANWHTTGSGHDLTGDDYVDDKDLSLVLANWHAGTQPAPAAAVPEPATLSLLVLGAIGSLYRRSARSPATN